MGTEVLEELKKSILTYNREGAANWAKKVVLEKIDPVEALDTMTVAIRQIGEGFGKGEFWLPDLVGAAAAMTSAMPIIEEEIKRVGAKRESEGIVVIGTVYGDIHTIGKTMVTTMLTADGFTVNDLGINVTAESFIKGITENKAEKI
jgi:methanogenic corrinoid protein MtbC1